MSEAMTKGLDGHELFLTAYLFCNHFMPTSIPPRMALGADDL
jgi:hypothetical protein